MRAPDSGAHMQEHRKATIGTEQGNQRLLQLISQDCQLSLIISGHLLLISECIPSNHLGIWHIISKSNSVFNDLPSSSQMVFCVIALWFLLLGVTLVFYPHYSQTLTVEIQHQR